MKLRKPKFGTRNKRNVTFELRISVICVKITRPCLNLTCNYDTYTKYVIYTYAKPYKFNRSRLTFDDRNNCESPKAVRAILTRQTNFVTKSQITFLSLVELHENSRLAQK